MIIRNGNLKDSTKELIDNYFLSKEVRYIDNENMESLAKSLNQGLKLSRNELIARMDPDDIHIRRDLKSNLKYLKK